MVDINKRYTEDEAASLRDRGFVLIDVTQLPDSQRHFMIVRFPSPEPVTSGYVQLTDFPKPRGLEWGDG